MNFKVLFITISCLWAVSTQAQCPVTITDLQATSATCIGDCNGSATVVATGPGNLTYQWFDGNGVPITGSVTETVSGVCAGAYTVEVTTDAGGGGSSTIYEEDFDGMLAWILLNSTGTNGSTPNFWIVSDAEGGVSPPGCGIQANGDNTLHITSAIFPTGGASYDAGGLCNYGFCPETSVRAESPDISTVGATGLTLNFDFISLGDGLTDNASVWYNDGSGWTELTGSIKSVNCQSGQGEWTAYSQALPTSCENIANLKVGINWVNNDDGVGSDPSVAINDLIITGTSGGGGGCTVLSDVVSIGQPQPIAIDSIVITDVSCAGNTDGSIILSVSGGNPSYTFSMDAGATFPNNNGLFNGLTVGFYGFVIQDNTGCTFDTDSIEVVETEVASPLVSGVLEYCEGGSTTISASFGFADYVWMPGNLTGASVDVTAGTYVAIATDANGCVVSSDSVTVIENLNPMPVIFGDSIVCKDETTILNAGDFSEYTWQPNGETTQTVEVGTGTYSVSVTDENGCSGSSASQTVSELVFTPLTISIMGDSLFVATGAGTVYQWHFNDAPIPGGVNSYFIATENGFYSLYYEDANGCSHFTDSVSIENVSVEWYDLDENVTVFPNPVSDQLTISYGESSSQEKTFTIAMMDATGRVVQTIITSSRYSQAIDVSMLNNGVYILQVKTENDVVVKRVVVQR